MAPRARGLSGGLNARVVLAADDDPDAVNRRVPECPQAVRRGGVERDRRPWAELVLIETDPHPEVSADDVAVLAPAVADERVLGTVGTVEARAVCVALGCHG